MVKKTFIETHWQRVGKPPNSFTCQAKQTHLNEHRSHIMNSMLKHNKSLWVFTKVEFMRSRCTWQGITKGEPIYATIRQSVQLLFDVETASNVFISPRPECGRRSITKKAKRKKAHKLININIWNNMSWPYGMTVWEMF